MTMGGPFQRALLLFFQKKKHLDKNFKVKQLGPLKYFLEIEFARSSEGILMTQQKYILELLEETKHTHCHISETPIEVNHKLTILETDPQIEISSYQKLIGKLLYLSHTRPDIYYSINVLSQFMHSPRNSHFQAANKILRYLNGTSGLGITYRKTSKLDLILLLTQIFLALVLTTGQPIWGEPSHMDEQETKCHIKIKYKSGIRSYV